MVIPSKPSAEKLAELLAKARAARGLQREAEIRAAAEMPENTPVSEAYKAVMSSPTETNNLSNNLDSSSVDKYGKAITYNEEQLRYVQLASSGASCVCIGAAGTGKTTSTRGSLLALIQNGHAGILQCEDHKYLKDGTPGVAIVSFTRRAVANIRKNLPEDLQANCLTIHALLEYEPVYFTVIDPDTGDEKNSMRFEPSRNAARPLPSSIRCCVIEESSMVSVELFKELSDALPPNCQFIFLGDIQQLPPVFGSAILGYKMLELPTVELTQVYRQALESPIIRLAHRILSGKPIPATEYPEWKYPNQLTLHPWKKKLHPDMALLTIAKFLTTAIDAGAYDPANDMVLIPFNKACGTIELNKHIANHLARKRNAVVYEVIAGFNKHYLAVGDKVLYDKEDAIVIDIKANANYSGAAPQAPSVTLDYWGFNDTDGNTEHSSISQDSGDDDIDFLLSQSVAIGSGEDTERVRQASHIVTVRMADTEREIHLETAADINSLLMSYALTVHKSQGSEFRKVFLVLHQSHATMLQRELLYTAVTRAKEELYVICEPESFTKGIKSQRIKGNTLAEKAEFFKGKLDGGVLK